MCFLDARQPQPANGGRSVCGSFCLRAALVNWRVAIRTRVEAGRTRFAARYEKRMIEGAHGNDRERVRSQSPRRLRRGENVGNLFC